MGSSVPPTTSTAVQLPQIRTMHWILHVPMFLIMTLLNMWIFLNTVCSCVILHIAYMKWCYLFLCKFGIPPLPSFVDSFLQRLWWWWALHLRSGSQCQTAASCPVSQILKLCVKCRNERHTELLCLNNVSFFYKRNIHVSNCSKTNFDFCYLHRFVAARNANLFYLDDF